MNLPRDLIVSVISYLDIEFYKKLNNYDILANRRIWKNKWGDLTEFGKYTQYFSKLKINCDITDVEISHLVNLQGLNCNWCPNITDVGISHLVNLKHLDC